jgi:hypothetical protein
MPRSASLEDGPVPVAERLPEHLGADHCDPSRRRRCPHEYRLSGGGGRASSSQRAAHEAPLGTRCCRNANGIAIHVERSYHRRRRQTALGRMIPVEYELIMTTTAAQAA